MFNVMAVPAVVIDTNVLIASGFNPKSHSAQIVEQVRCGPLRMVWTEQTRDEAAFIIGKIPPLSWEAIALLFRPEDCYDGALFPEQFQQVPDKADIKFAALSDATGAPLITMDKALLSIRETLNVPMLMPFEFLAL
ncbi:MAG: PIN domain-containing protein [Thermosynechococcaceae cyanobacterium MS004]|nr:PIN domain-containing protein [Thermosynechococcaceae cyanobacterium MS004]